jgi:hypothetical protein
VFLFGGGVSLLDSAAAAAAMQRIFYYRYSSILNSMVLLVYLQLCNQLITQLMFAYSFVLCVCLRADCCFDCSNAMNL